MARPKLKRVARLKTLSKPGTSYVASADGCNDAIASYVKTVDIEYGQPQPRGSCEKPSEAEEGAAMNAAKNAFKAAANAYCGQGACPKPAQTCAASVSISSIENQGVVETKAGELKRCAIKFKITGSVSCSCPGEA